MEGHAPRKAVFQAFMQILVAVARLARLLLFFLVGPLWTTPGKERGRAATYHEVHDDGFGGWNNVRWAVGQPVLGAAVPWWAAGGILPGGHR
jgi:hypothetical protein